MLESAKDRVLGVDTQGQQVSPRVRCETACLLIRDAVGSVPCSDEWEIGVVTRLGSLVQVGSWYRVLPLETLALLWYRVLPQETFVMASSDLWAIHQRKCKNGKMEISLVA
jgi:hypothetical protein